MNRMCDAVYRPCPAPVQQTDSQNPLAHLQSKVPTLYHPNPFAVRHAGALEWCTNDLILHDAEMRKQAKVAPLDCGLMEMYRLNPEPQL